MSPPPDAERIPDIWLRAFYGFDPTTDGYIGWTKEGDRDFMLREATPGDLCLIYGAERNNPAGDNT